MRNAYILLAFGCVIGRPAPVWAQPPKLELSGGYASMRDELIDLSFPIGWVGGVAVGVNGWLSGVGEASGNYRTLTAPGGDLHLSMSSVLAGARISGKIGRFAEFGQILAGYVRARGEAFQIASSRSLLGLQAGAGLDFAVIRTLAVRVQADVRSTRGDEGGGEPARQIRLSAGLAVRLR